MTWSEKVKYVRIRLQMTQVELSKATGIPVVTIARWETTNSEPQPKSRGKFLSFCEENNIFLEENFDTRENKRY